MSRVRSTDTTPELTVRKLAHARGLRFRKHCAWLPGRPDLVFVTARVVVFVDGDYWHGWRFSTWKDKLLPYWKQKIAGNRRRDLCNFKKLRRAGWLVIRLWEHQVGRDAKSCIDRIQMAVRERNGNFDGGTTSSKPRLPVADRGDTLLFALSQRRPSISSADFERAKKPLI